MITAQYLHSHDITVCCGDTCMLYCYCYVTICTTEYM